ncbi:MAG: phosphotransferase [Pseudomonadota bacterium]
MAAHSARDATLSDATLYASNAWTWVGQEVVFRIGEAIDLKIDLEERCWERGRRCGAATPRLLETGIFQARRYMVTDRLTGAHPDATLPRTAGVFLAALHGGSAGGLRRRGNWPARRDRRYPAAWDHAHGVLASGHPALGLIEAAQRDLREGRLVPNHGDFRAANMLVGPGDVLGVLDWSDFHAGTREEDLGGCDPALIPALLHGYQRARSVPIDPALVAGHAFARLFSLCAFGVLPLCNALESVPVLLGLAADLGVRSC